MSSRLNYGLWLTINGTPHKKDRPNTCYRLTTQLAEDRGGQMPPKATKAPSLPAILPAESTTSNSKLSFSLSRIGVLHCGQAGTWLVPFCLPVFWMSAIQSSKQGSWATSEHRHGALHSALDSPSSSSAEKQIQHLRPSSAAGGSRTSDVWVEGVRGVRWMRVESAGASEGAGTVWASGTEVDDESVRAGDGRMAVAEGCELADIVGAVVVGVVAVVVVLVSEWGTVAIPWPGVIRPT